MGAAPLAVALMGLALPITLILAAVLIDALVIVWAAWTLTSRRWSRPLHDTVHAHLIAPFVRLRHAHPLPHRG